MNTSPRPSRYAKQCYDLMETVLDPDVTVELTELLERYMCVSCPNDYKHICGLPFEWICASTSEIIDCHGGFMPFTTARDMMVLHTKAILVQHEFVGQAMLSNGYTIRNFVRTKHGVLTDSAMKAPGSLLVYITGSSKHSTLYRDVPGFGGLQKVLNTRYSGVRSTAYAMILLTNPNQDVNLQLGRIGFDMNPRVLSPWSSAFYNTWADFVYFNPGVEITELYMTDGGVFLGSPTSTPNARKLYSNTGFPLVIQYYRDLLAKHVGKLLAMSKMNASDDADVPAGKLFYKLVSFDIFLDIQALRSAVQSGPFATTGKLVYQGDDPTATYNLAIGKIILLLWEYVDILRSWNVLGMAWSLRDFVSRKVSSSDTSLFRFSRTMAQTHQTLVRHTDSNICFLGHYVHSGALRTLFTCFGMSFCA